MGIKTHTVTVATCDMCHAECGGTDGEIRIQVNNGDGRDVGPAFVSGELRFDQPYGVSGGILCQACKFKWLRKYLEQEEWIS